MSLPRASVARPIFTTMVTLIVVIVGAVSLSRLRIDLLPNIEMPTLTVRTEYEGASPEVMERLVTQVAEEIIATVPGVEEITSESSEGSSRIRVSFVWGTDIDTAALDVRAGSRMKSMSCRTTWSAPGSGSSISPASRWSCSGFRAGSIRWN